MVDSRSSSHNGGLRFGKAADLDYCRRLSAYLGLSLEAAIFLTRQGGSAARTISRARPAK